MSGMSKKSLFILGCLFSPLAQGILSHECEGFQQALSSCQPFKCGASADLSIISPEMRKMIEPDKIVGIPGLPEIPPELLKTAQRLDFSFEISGQAGSLCRYQDGVMVDREKTFYRKCQLSEQDVRTFASQPGLPPVLPQQLSANCQTGGDFSATTPETYINVQPVIIQKQEGSQYEWYQ